MQFRNVKGVDVWETFMLISSFHIKLFHMKIKLFNFRQHYVGLCVLRCSSAVFLTNKDSHNCTIHAAFYRLAHYAVPLLYSLLIQYA